MGKMFPILTETTRALTEQIKNIGFKKSDPGFHQAFDQFMLYLENKSTLIELRRAYGTFIDLKNQSILDKRPRDAMLYNVLAYLGCALECDAEDNKEECNQYLKASLSLLSKAKKEQ
jgi:hypothetical protein